MCYGSVLELGEGSLLGLFSQIVLELAGLVRDEAERVVQRQPLDIRLILVKVLPQAVELREQGLGFHGCRSVDALIGAR
ncbi:MAG: hypothetical protein AAFY46_17085 [Planctomycetota bacterium]